MRGTNPSRRSILGSGSNTHPSREEWKFSHGSHGTYQQRNRPRAVVRSAVHGRARHCDRECGAAIDSAGSRHRAEHVAVDHHRVQPHARRIPAARRQDGRPLGTPPHAPDGIDAVLVRLTARGRGGIRGAPDRRPCLAGIRGGASPTGSPVNPRRNVPGGRRAQSRIRDLRRHRRDLGVGRGDRQWSAHGRPRLALGLLHQRPGRRPSHRDSDHLPRRRRSRRAPERTLRRRRRGHSDRGACSSSSTRSTAAPTSAGVPRQRSDCSPRPP
jgi:hypothetical protein